MTAATARRVREHTREEWNEEIQKRTERSIAYHAAHPEEIEDRLAELDREWDVERTLQTSAASLSLLGLVLGVGASRRWLVLSAAVSGFLLQHAVQGWCPPLAVVRRLGVRTAQEIDAERYALKALRGDFEDLPGAQGDGLRRLLAAVRR